MKNSKKYIFLVITAMFYWQALFAAQTGPERAPYTPPVLVEPTVSPQSLEQRSLIMLIESGANENALSWLYSSDQSIIRAMTNDFMNALNSDPRSPILVSEALVRNVAIFHKLCADLLTKDNVTLEGLYNGTERFKKPETLAAFKEIAQFLYQDHIKMAALVKAYSENPTQPNKDAVIAAIQNTVKQNNVLVEKYGQDIFQDARAIFESYNAYNPQQWAAGKTKNGDFVFAPKDAAGKIINFGFNYSALEGLDGKSTVDPLSLTGLDPATIYSASMAYPEKIIEGFRQLTGRTEGTSAENPLRPLDMYLTGHGGPPEIVQQEIDNLKGMITDLQFNKAIKKVGAFLGWDTTAQEKAYTSMITYYQERLAALQQSDVTEASHIAGISDTSFNESLVPALAKANTRTFAYETCYGGDINQLKGWKDTSTDRMGEHSFTIINGALSLASITTNINGYITEALRVVKLDPTKLQSTELSSRTPRNFGSYFKDLASNIGIAIKNFFDRGGGARKIDDVTNIPQVKLATTDYWISFNDVSNDIVQISNTDAATGKANLQPVVYNKSGTKGTILLSSSTLLTPLELGDASREMPHIIPMSIGNALHYMDKVTLPGGAQIEDFFKESLQPFYSEMAKLPPDIQKSMVINTMAAGGKEYQVVITNDYALYVEVGAPLVRSGIKNFFRKDIDLKVVSLSGKELPFDYTDLRKEFKTKLAQGQEQAFAENERLNVESEAWKTSLSTITDRRNLINLLDKVTGEKRTKKGEAELDWATISDEPADKISDRIAEILKTQPLDPKIVMYMSDSEVKILFDILQETVSQDQTNKNLTDAFTMIRDDSERRELKAQLIEKQKNGLDASIDWYTELTPAQKKLIKPNFDSITGLVPYLSQNVNALTLKELQTMKDYLQAIKDRGTSTVQGAIVDNIIKNIDAALIKGPNKTMLLKELSKRSGPENEEQLIDWVADLTEEEKTLIQTQLNDIIVNNHFFVLLDQTQSSFYRMNIQELDTLKRELGQFETLPKYAGNAELTNIISKAGKQIQNKLFDYLQSFPSGPERDKAIEDLLNPKNPAALDIYAQAYKDLPPKARQSLAEIVGKNDPYSAAPTGGTTGTGTTPNPHDEVKDKLLGAITLDELTAVLNEAKTQGIDIQTIPELETAFKDRQTKIVTENMNLALNVDELLAIAQDATAHGIEVKAGTPLGDALLAKRQELLNRSSGATSGNPRTTTGGGTVIDPTTTGGDHGTTGGDTGPSSGTQQPYRNPYENWTPTDGAPIEPLEPGPHATQEEQQEYEEQQRDWEKAHQTWQEHLVLEHQQATGQDHGGTPTDHPGEVVDHSSSSGEHGVPK